MAKQGEASVEKNAMPFETAQALLASANKDILEDRAFGDSEGGWHKDGQEIATFYFSRNGHSVFINETEEFAATTFEADQADAVEELGTLVQFNYNDDGCQD